MQILIIVPFQYLIIFLKTKWESYLIPESGRLFTLTKLTIGNWCGVHLYLFFACETTVHLWDVRCTRSSCETWYLYVIQVENTWSYIDGLRTYHQLINGVWGWGCRSDWPYPLSETLFFNCHFGCNVHLFHPFSKILDPPWRTNFSCCAVTPYSVTGRRYCRVERQRHTKYNLVPRVLLASVQTSWLLLQPILWPTNCSYTIKAITVYSGTLWPR